MSHEIKWNKIILEEFIDLALLTKEEEMVMRTRVAGWTISEQASAFGMSISKVNKLVSRCKRKYDEVQPYSPLLPPRRMSAEERYLDTH